ncbi:ANO8 protein, partial [Chunga burmeisteri]|nr:ANO8 protein [Chunga burmeisteri]
MSHKAWMKTVPTENCDVLMTFPDTTDDHTLLWLLNHIRLGIPELIVQVRHHKHTRVYAFFVTATYESLLRGADEIGLRKPVKAEFGGGMRSFSCEEDYIYENIENELYFFTSQVGCGGTRDMGRGCGDAGIPRWWGRGRTVRLPRAAGRGGVGDGRGPTPVQLVPSVPQTSQDICCVVFAIFNVIWATLFLEEWKRRGAEFAYKWGTLDTPAESIEEPRPQFRGIKRISPVTSAEEFYYPPWKRLLFQCLVSLPVCLACLSLIFLLMLGCFQLQEFVLSIQGLPRIIRFLPKIVLAIIVTTCDEVYKKIAYWLNDMGAW